MKEEAFNAKQSKSKEVIVTKGKLGLPSSEESFMRILCSKEKAMSALDELDDGENRNDIYECSLFYFLCDDKIKKINSNVFLVSENDDYNESNVYNDNDSTADS